MQAPSIEELRAMGGLSETRALVHRPRSVDELRELFVEATRRKSPRTFTLVGGRHSFGGHFLPTEDGEAIDTTALPVSVTRLEADGPEGLWVRVSGNATFEALAAAVPGYLPRHPPTSDLVTLAGALAGCTHDSVGFFAKYVRRFSLLTPDGRIHDCSAGAEGIAGDLFRAVPGSFGALGAVLDLELRTYFAGERRRVEITVAHEGRYEDGESLARLERSFEHGPSWGAGFYVFGLRGKTIVLEARVIDATEAQGLPDLPLTDDATTRNVLLQAVANRFPAIAHRLASSVLRGGKRFGASIYGHAFFQRSYARSRPILTSKGLGARTLSYFGVDPRLPVVHQTYVVPPRSMRPFLDLYFEVLEQNPELVPRIEQQDNVRMPECPWPLHGAFGMTGGPFLFSPSMSVPRGSRLEGAARAFFETVANRAYRELGVKILLLKQMHVDRALLREMHGPAIAHLAHLKRAIDPRGLLSSQFLDDLLPRSASDARSLPAA